MLIHRPSQAGGQTVSGTIETRHAFSCGARPDPVHGGLGPLRAIDEAAVGPGAGIAKHAQATMEIVAIVPDGRGDVALDAGAPAGGAGVRHAVAPGRAVWLQVLAGRPGVSGVGRAAGDGLALVDETAAWIEAAGIVGAGIEVTGRAQVLLAEVRPRAAAVAARALSGRDVGRFET
ncbi:MAG: hypothetical protein AAFV86_18475, partial [Pseudomonadota bacterium]